MHACVYLCECMCHVVVQNSGVVHVGLCMGAMQHLPRPQA